MEYFFELVNDAFAQLTSERYVRMDQRIKEKYVHHWHIYRLWLIFN